MVQFHDTLYENQRRSHVRLLREAAVRLDHNVHGKEGIPSVVRGVPQKDGEIMTPTETPMRKMSEGTKLVIKVLLLVVLIEIALFGIATVIYYGT